MEPNFWHERWQENQIGFHLPEAHDLLVKYSSRFQLPQGAPVFLPLCGKTRDIGWLLSQGFYVKGVELSELAVEQLFAELEVTPQITQKGPLKLYQAPMLEVWVGDIFDLTPELLGPVTLTYDRAALVALPLDMRRRYSTHLLTITSNSPQLLITFTYDQALISGPPFSIDAQEVRAHYSGFGAVELLETRKAKQNLKGLSEVEEHAWSLR